MARHSNRLTGPVHLAVVAVLTGLFAGGCGTGSGAAAPEPPPRWNVVVVLVDTLRAQNLGVYGYGRPTSPTLDAFARQNVLFTDARSQAPCTFPSANTILTGRFTTEFLGRSGNFMGIPEGMPSLAEILADAGYATVAVSASPIVRKNPSRFNPQGGFDRGFDLFEERCIWQSADCVNQHAATYLDVLREPFFLYLHYMDPHGPFRPPESWERRFAGDGADLPEHVRQGDPNPIAEMIYKGRPETFTDADIAHLVDLYDDEIAYFDSQLARLLERLREDDLLDRTILFLVADHGEEFLEHGHIKHCQTLFDTEVKTPMVLALPAAAAAERLDSGKSLEVAAPVANQSVMPTVLELLEIDPGAHGVGGGEAAAASGWAPSLLPLLERSAAEEASEPEPVFSAWGRQRGVFDGRYKLVYELTDDSFRLFDTEADPGEQDELLARAEAAGEPEPEAFRRLKRVLFQFLIDTERGDREAAAAAGTATEDQLRALGYIQ